jgi:serine/threonine protein phosphatase 1
VIALMGNHEDMLLDYFSGMDNSWTLNGHTKTIASYKGYYEEFDNDMEWMKNLPLYHEDEYFIYVHAGIDVNKPMNKQDKNTLLWVRNPFIYNKKAYHKRVIFGHTPTLNMSDDNYPICTYTNNIDIDTGCVYGGALTALIIDDDEINGFYQIEKLNNKHIA